MIFEGTVYRCSCTSVNKYFRNKIVNYNAKGFRYLTTTKRSETRKTGTNASRSHSNKSDSADDGGKSNNYYKGYASKVGIAAAGVLLSISGSALISSESENSGDNSYNDVKFSKHFTSLRNKIFDKLNVKTVDGTSDNNNSKENNNSSSDSSI